MPPLTATMQPGLGSHLQLLAMPRATGSGLEFHVLPGCAWHRHPTLGCSLWGLGWCWGLHRLPVGSSSSPLLGSPRGRRASPDLEWLQLLEEK